MNRRKFIKTVSFLAALPFLPKVVAKRLDSVVPKVVFSAPRTLTGSEWGKLLAPDLREVYLETGRECQRDKAMANILNNAFETRYTKEEKK